MSTTTPLPPQLTARAIVLAVVLAMILAAANTYLGLFAGMTIASAIPAAVVSMAVLRVLGGGGILENNIVQTGGSAGASLASGVIFTIPALVILGFWDDFDFLFLHVKQTDQAGEDGDFARKARALEEVDAALPRLLALGPEVIAVTGDHSTPAPMKAHSWHPVPVLLAAPNAFVDDCDRFDEAAAIRGHLGTLPSCTLLALLLAHGGRLQKFGA